MGIVGVKGLSGTNFHAERLREEVREIRRSVEQGLRDIEAKAFLPSSSSSSFEWLAFLLVNKE